MLVVRQFGQIVNEVLGGGITNARPNSTKTSLF